VLVAHLVPVSWSSASPSCTAAPPRPCLWTTISVGLARADSLDRSIGSTSRPEWVSGR
jgi:hypothetical protein